MTAVADGLAGFAASGAAYSDALPWLLAATSCLYAGGVTLNDFFDRELDAVERPERPIPSGRVRPAAAAFLGGTLLGTGVLTAAQASAEAGWIAAAIVLAVLVYDSWGKHRTFLGPVNMGVCRGLNLLLGISAAPGAIYTRWYLALIPFIYICGITALSRGEVHGGKRPVAIFSTLTVAFVVSVLAVLALLRAQPAWLALALTAAFAARVLPPFLRTIRNADAAAVRTAIRTGVLSLVLLDAVIGGLFAGALYSFLILATAIVAIGLARLFAVT
jgi:4-hydroxybenzoate polyprenyltransferase